MSFVYVRFTDQPQPQKIECDTWEYSRGAWLGGRNRTHHRFCYHKDTWEIYKTRWALQLSDTVYDVQNTKNGFERVMIRMELLYFNEYNHSLMDYLDLVGQNKKTNKHD